MSACSESGLYAKARDATVNKTHSRSKIAPGLWVTKMCSYPPDSWPPQPAEFHLLPAQSGTGDI